MTAVFFSTQNSDKSSHVLISLIAMVYFDDPFSLGGNETESIITGKKIHSFSGQPVDVCILGINHILS